MAPQTVSLALLYIFALASATNAAPIRRHDMSKRNAALKVVKRDSEEALSPLARFLKGFSAAQTDSESAQQDQGAVVAKLGQDVNDTVRLVMANPMGSPSSSSAATASSVSAMVDQGAMQSAYAQAIDGLDAPASSAAPVASTSAMEDTDEMQEAYNQAIQGLSQESDDQDNDESHSAMVDQDAMVDAYQQAVEGLQENASDSSSFETQKAKRSYYDQVENQLQTPGTVSASASDVPTPTASDIIVNVDGSLMPFKAFPTITERLVPTTIIEKAWSSSGSSSVEVDYTRLAYQVEDSPVSAIAMEEAHSAPASRRPAPSGASAPVASHSAVVSAEDSEALEENVPLPNQKAQYLPLKHGF